MLQRAASNAYSWWWASHIRTKQSKWLEQNLQDMGEKVEAVLRLIEEDGDSFIKRAEMYYKKRPEFISFVEESYRAYRSLAERYDLLSKELQNANSTLASAFPDQFQYHIDDDDEDEDGPPKLPKKLPDKPPNPNIPKAPAKFPTKRIKAYMALTAKPKKAGNKGTSKPASNAQKSGLTISEAVEEVDKLQKRILALQTEKEFAKNSYESGCAKYWQIEEEIAGIQEKISKLQDEFEINQVIEDDEARTLMVETAVKSCQEMLARLQEKQEKAAEEANAERQRIKAARQKLMSLKGEVLGTEQGNLAETSEVGDLFKDENNWASFDDELDGLNESKGLEMLREKIKEHFDVGSTASLTVTQMAEKVDELVNKVIDLETSVSSQTSLIHRLRSETDDLQSHIKSLEDDKANLIDGKNTLNDKLREMENKLKELQDLNRSFENQNTSLEAHFTEARSNIDAISEKLHNIRPDEEVQESSQVQETGGLAAMDVKLEVLQDMKGSDTSSLVISQDREKDEKPVQQESDGLVLSRGTGNTQLDEQPITKEHKPSTLDVDQPEECPREHQPSTFDAEQPQEHSEEHKPSTFDVAQQEKPPSEHMPSTYEFGQLDEHRKEHQPSTFTFDVVQPQEHRKKYEWSTFDVEPPGENKPSTLDVAQLDEHPEEHHPSTFDAAYPQANLLEHKATTLVDQQIEPPRELMPSIVDITQLVEYPGKEDMELVISDETQQWEPAVLSVSSQETQETKTKSMVRENLNAPSSAKPPEQARKEEDEPDWQQLFMNGLEGKEKILLAEYTSTLRNYKEAKKKLVEIENKTQADLSEIAAQLQELRNCNAKKDEEIWSLQQKMYILQKTLDECRSSNDLKDMGPPKETAEPSLPLEDDEDMQFIAQAEEISPLEQKLRADIDEILEENLDFWMRFSASFSQVQKFQTEVEDLHAEIAKLEKDHEKKEGSGHGSSNGRSCASMKSDIKPLYKHLREIQTELTVWLEQSEKLRDELQGRFSQLCNIQEEIKQALNDGAEDDEMKFTSYQAAKFQGEAANMQQENNKVADELQAGMEHVTSLQLEVERTLTRLNEELGLGLKSQGEDQAKSRSVKVPLRSFIFGDKPQKKKPSIFSFVHQMKHRRHQHLKSGKPQRSSSTLP